VFACRNWAPDRGFRPQVDKPRTVRTSANRVDSSAPGSGVLRPPDDRTGESPNSGSDNTPSSDARASDRP